MASLLRVRTFTSVAYRNRITLDKLRPYEGSTKKKKRLGRGREEGTERLGRGHKGAKARQGNDGFHKGFEGGQFPLYRRLPKFGFTNKKFKKKPINVT